MLNLFGRGFEKIKKEFEAHNSPLPEVEIKIIELVKENNKITRTQLVNRLKINESTVKRNLNKLKTKGILKGFGANKNGYWTIL